MTKDTFIRSIAPAIPGWFVVEHCIGNAEFPDSLSEEPVIAWIVVAKIDDDDDCNRSVAHAVTADWAANEVFPLILKRPDGTYLCPGEQSFDSADKVLEYLKAERTLKERKINMSR